MIGKPIVSLLRPNLAIAYRVCCWLISGAEEDRRSGRSSVLAAAFLREAVQGRSARLLDHYAGENNQTTFLANMIRGFADDLGFTAEMRGSRGQILSEVKNLSTMERLTLTGEASWSPATHVAALRQIAMEAHRAGMSESQIVDSVRTAVREDIVMQVHDL